MQEKGRIIMSSENNQRVLRNASREEQFKKAASLAGEAIKSIGSPFNIGKYMLSLAIDREAPLDVQEVIQIFAKDTLDDRLETTLADATKELASLPKEDVYITSLDGLKLTGHIIKSKHQKRVIIAFHGWRSTWMRDFSIITDFLFDNDCTVLFAEQRAQGESEGDYMSFGVFERFDCLDWVNFAEERFGKNVPIYLAGVSMGASTVLMASGNKFPSNVRGIIADCGFTSPEAIWRHVAVDNLHLIYPASTLEKLCQETLHFDPAKHSTISALEKATVPVLFAHGQDDHFVPMEMTLENYDACASEKEIILVPGAEHGLSYYVDGDRYREKLSGFWKKHE